MRWCECVYMSGCVCAHLRGSKVCVCVCVIYFFVCRKIREKKQIELNAPDPDRPISFLLHGRGMNQVQVFTETSCPSFSFKFAASSFSVNKPRMVNAPEGLNIIISLAHEKNA